MSDTLVAFTPAIHNLVEVFPSIRGLLLPKHSGHFHIERPIPFQHHATDLKPTDTNVPPFHLKWRFHLSQCLSRRLVQQGSVLISATGLAAAGSHSPAKVTQHESAVAGCTGNRKLKVHYLRNIKNGGGMESASCGKR